MLLGGGDLALGGGGGGGGRLGAHLFLGWVVVVIDAVDS